MAELSRRVDLVILQGSDGSEVVSERRPEGLIEVYTTTSLEAAQAWAEAIYDGVEWRKPRLGTALIGTLTGGECGGADAT